MHARPVGIKDPRHLDLQSMLSPVIEKECLGTTLSLVVTGTGAHGVDAAPVILSLGMYLRVSVHLAGRGLQDSRASAFSQSQHVDRAMYTGLGCLYRIRLVVNRRRRTGQVVDLIHLDIKRKGDIMANQFEIRETEKMGYVAFVAGKKVIQTNNVIALFDQSVT